MLPITNAHGSLLPSHVCKQVLIILILRARQPLLLSSQGRQRTFPDAKELKIRLFARHNVCSRCGMEILKIEHAELDHIIPFSEGGESTESNAQLLHAQCNREKGNRA